MSLLPTIESLDKEIEEVDSASSQFTVGTKMYTPNGIYEVTKVLPRYTHLKLIESYTGSCYQRTIKTLRRKNYLYSKDSWYDEKILVKWINDKGTSEKLHKLFRSNNMVGLEGTREYNEYKKKKTLKESEGGVYNKGDVWQTDVSHDDASHDTLHDVVQYKILWVTKKTAAIQRLDDGKITIGKIHTVKKVDNNTALHSKKVGRLIPASSGLFTKKAK